MDYRIYHAINQFVADHSWLGRGLNTVETWAVPVIAVATFALWLLARPGGDRKWKLASASALASGALALDQPGDRTVLASGTAVRRPSPSARMGQPVPRPVIPKRPRKRRLRDRLRRLPIRPARRRPLPPRRYDRRCRACLHRRPLPGRHRRRLHRRASLSPTRRSPRPARDRAARQARRANHRSAARTPPAALDGGSLAVDFRGAPDGAPRRRPPSPSSRRSCWPP